MSKFEHEWNRVEGTDSRTYRFLQYCVNKWMNSEGRITGWFWLYLLKWVDARWRKKQRGY